MTTVAEARQTGRKRLETIDSAQLDADLLLAHVLDWKREQLFSRNDLTLSPDQLGDFFSCLERRASGVPVAYITGHKEFFGIQLEVSEDVLIPRPETELLVEAAIHHVRTTEARSIVDVGTGSGAIAIALAVSLAGVEITATDISGPALNVAGRNIKAHGLTDRIELVQGDLLGPILSEPDLIMANLPYIAQQDVKHLAVDVLHEPSLALFAGIDGIDIISRLLQKMADRGWSSDLILEIDPRQVGPISEKAQAFLPGHSLDVVADLSGLDRLLVMRRYPSLAAPRPSAQIALSRLKVEHSDSSLNRPYQPFAEGVPFLGRGVTGVTSAKKH